MRCDASSSPSFGGRKAVEKIAGKTWELKAAFAFQEESSMVLLEF